MLPVILLKGVEPVTPGKPIGSGRADALRLLPQLDPGDILSARVEAKLPDGSYKVMVAGQPLRMNLPSYIAPGDTLELAFVSRDPRLTFVLKNMQQAAPAPAPASAPTTAPLLSAAGRSATAGLAQPGEPGLPSSAAPADTLELALVTHESRLAPAPKSAPQTAQAPAPAPAIVLSAAGRLVAATMLQPGEVALPVAASATAPLMAAPPADGAQLAIALARTLAGSGLFYESHQAAWVAGKLDLAQIRQEPQARLTQSAPARAADTAAAAAAAELPAAGTARLQQSSVQQTIHPHTVPLVQQQLAALDAGKVMMQLEIWPKQWMQWEIEEQQSGTGREADADTPQSWNTELRLQLPLLGELKAALSIAGDGVRIRLETANASSAALLREHSASLQTALAAAGVPPAGIAIAQHEQA
ncbi:MAG: flagellar hook-length control protein FliK [Burkholderiales bacterium]|nr:flagellar hook-length control protein FliK [Burkholderiales bacterium]